MAEKPLALPPTRNTEADKDLALSPAGVRDASFGDSLDESLTARRLALAPGAQSPLAEKGETNAKARPRSSAGATTAFVPPRDRAAGFASRARGAIARMLAPLRRA